VPTTGVAIKVPDPIWPACQSLSRDDRTALVLRYYEGLSDDEIADLTGVREAVARSRASDGVAAVRAELAEP
jgi:DNA-directed RNA polymerase specialized sigma24 family protein